MRGGIYLLVKTQELINTYTGLQLNIDNPIDEQISIVDIAHSLSLICRFCGQSKIFYSVAQHSINLANILAFKGYNDEIKLYGLLHDAAEAYICDMPTPIKNVLPEYKKLENKIQDVIYKSVFLQKPSDEYQQIIKAFDTELLMIEADALMVNFNKKHKSINEFNIEIKYEIPIKVEQKFYEMFCNYFKMKINSEL